MSKKKNPVGWLGTSGYQTTISPMLMDAEIGAMWEGLEERVMRAAPTRAEAIMAAVRKVVDAEIRRTLMRAVKEAQSA